MKKNIPMVIVLVIIEYLAIICKAAVEKSIYKTE